MAFNIHKLSPDFDAQNFEFYFFDSNSWIFFLKNLYYRNKTEAYGIPYANLFSQIVTLNSDETKKKTKVKPKIVVTSLLLTELINAYLRRVAMKEYCDSISKKYDPSRFKEEYRDNPTTDYKTQLRRFINDFSSFKDFIHLRDDNFNEIDPYSILKGLENQKVDFNDFYYYYHLVEKNVAIVTHDKDFAFQDIPIITAHKDLIKLI